MRATLWVVVSTSALASCIVINTNKPGATTAAQATGSPVVRGALSGRRQVLASFYATDSNCASLGYPTLKTAKAPLHGAVAIEQGTALADLGQDDARHICNGQSVPATVVYYTSEPGFVGTDSVEFERIGVRGAYGLHAYLVNVRMASPDNRADLTRFGSAPVTDESAIRAMNSAWYKAYNAGDGASVAALYADDAVTSPPGAPAVRGESPILEYFMKDAAAFAATGYVDSDGPASDLEISGDVAWQWGTYKITDYGGAVAATGKYLSVMQRRGGKWVIIRDIYNSDTPIDGPVWTPRQTRSAGSDR